MKYLKVLSPQSASVLCPTPSKLPAGFAPDFHTETDNAYKGTFCVPNFERVMGPCLHL